MSDISWLTFLGIPNIRINDVGHKVRTGTPAFTPRMWGCMHLKTNLRPLAVRSIGRYGKEVAQDSANGIWQVVAETFLRIRQALVEQPFKASRLREPCAQRLI